MRPTDPQSCRTAAARRPAGIAVVLCLLTAATTAQQERSRPQQVSRRIVEHAIDFATSQDDNLFSLVRSQDNIHAWEEGVAAIEAGDHQTGVERLHRLLQTEGGGVVPVAPGRFLGLRLAVITTMANMPAPAKAAYEDLVRREAGAVADLATLSREHLLLLAEKFPAASVGLRARIRLGDLALVAGDGLAAAGHFRSALDATPIRSADEERVLARLHAAAILVDPRTARAAAESHTLDGEGDDVLAVLPPPAAAPTWGALGGGASGCTPMQAPTGQPDTRWSEEVIAPGFGRRDSGQFAMFPVGDLDGIFVNTGRKVIALDPLRRGRAWEFDSPLAEERNDGYRGSGADTEGINQDMPLAAACNGEVVVAGLQVPERSMTVDFNGGFRVMSKIPMRRLFGFSRQSGKVLWSHYDELDGPRTRRFRGHDVCASPLIAGDTLYVPVHDRSGAIAFAIAAYDVRTGQPKWRRLVCSSQQDVNMFGNARTEFAASPLALHDGVLHGASNLGVAFAVEATTGRLRWITSYDVVRMPRAALQNQPDRQVYFANNAPVVADGVVCCTPLDSQFVLGIDTENGRVLWRLPSEASVDGIDNRVLWLAGAFGDEFVLAGAGSVAVKARPAQLAGDRPAVRQLARPELLDRRSAAMPPRPAVTANALWFARNDRLVAVDRDGNPQPRDDQIPMGRYLPGNLLLIGGIVVSLRQHGVDVAYDAAALLAHVQQQVAAAPDDPTALLRLASLQRALLPENPSAEAAAAMRALYQRGLDACEHRGLPRQHPVRVALQQELFTQAFADARAALQRHTPDAMALLAAARDVAPDLDRWVEVQALVLEQSTGSRFADELSRLETNAAGASFPNRDGVPVPAWVAWQRARTAAAPAEAVARWQDLLERHGTVSLGERDAGEVAKAAIAELIRAHGATCYAAVEARAEAAASTAGSDPQALAAVVRRFPNSAAAANVRASLLDAAVRAGDLRAACGVLAQALQTGNLPPGIARRVIVAAAAAGNHALASAMAGRLREHASERSDWPDDHGATYGAVIGELELPVVTPARLVVPAGQVARIARPSANLDLVPTARADGFAMPADVPVYARADRKLLALDVHAAGTEKPVLFEVPVASLEHVVVCGTTLVVPDMERVFAVDYRSGELRWEMPNPHLRTFEYLGLQQGVVHVFEMPATGVGTGELSGIEPLTGSLLFRQTHPASSTWPKAIPGGLLRLTIAADSAAAIEILEPLGGTVQRTIAIAGDVMRQHLQFDADLVATRPYPQYLSSDGTLVFLPVDSTTSTDTPRLLALDGAGRIAWQWRGQQGRLLSAALRGDRIVVVESSEEQPARVLLLKADNGDVVREVVAGYDTKVLNWERSWRPNPAPSTLAIESFADVERSQRQLLCFSTTDEGNTFVVTLGTEDGEVVRAPQFGADFVTFGVRPLKGAGGLRLYALSLQDRAGLMPGGAKYRRIDGAVTADAMATSGPYTVISGAQGLLLLGNPGQPR